MKIKAVSAGLLAAALATMPISSASARGNFYHHGHGHGHRLGLIGALVGGVAAIVVAPFVILGDAVSDGGEHRHRGYDRGDDDGNARGSTYNRPPSGYYADRREAYDGPPQGNGYDAPPPDYYPPPQRQYAPSQNYAPPQEYAPRQNYDLQARQYGPPQQYAPQDRGGYPSQPEYYPPPDGE